MMYILIEIENLLKIISFTIMAIPLTQSTISTRLISGTRCIINRAAIATELKKQKPMAESGSA